MKTRSLCAAAVLIGVATFLAVSPAGAQTISVSASPSVITNEADVSTITFTAFPAPTRILSVNYMLTGTAALGSDYALIGTFTKSGQVTIPAGQVTTTITLQTFYDADPFASEFAVLTLLHGRGYRVGSPSRARIDIENIKDH